ncbi:nitrite reductase, copper-containing [Helicocarpus griseus UAMH5409]|uniref:Copper-containing nitrite reductase n=1 Tax=Helicocarpus griseus UAMH5409 TaxID=1447875 RepID=A0A2B7XX29_9EURO|nr:nitrite reductase, copper-containing [Helicocarpus griseus UAMH5409]
MNKLHRSVYMRWTTPLASRQYSTLRCGASSSRPLRPCCPPPLRQSRRSLVRVYSTDASKPPANKANTGIIAAVVAASVGLGGLMVYRRRGSNVHTDSEQKFPPHPDVLLGRQEAADPGELAARSLAIAELPVEEAQLTFAPNVPPAITRDHPVLLKVPLTTSTKVNQLTSTYKYEHWTFNGKSPGPFIRARVGDVVELTLTNKDVTGNPHNIDSHAFTGPGGGASLTTAEENQTKTGRFKLLYPGLFIYHCAAAPVPVHIANGMYGLIYVQPEKDDLPKVDREYYVMQSEFYHEPPEVENGKRSSTVEFSYPNALREDPDVVVFNGSETALTMEHPLKALTGETIRVFFGNAGPNLTSSPHIIGGAFHKLYRDGDVLTAPARNVSTTTVPPGGATIFDMKTVVPGTYTLVDHAIFRLDKGCVGYINVSGKPRPDIYQSAEHPEPCVGCKLHP